MRTSGSVSMGRFSLIGRACLLAALGGGIAAPALVAAQTAPQTAVVATPPAQVSAIPANGVGSAFELTFWQSVAGSDDPAVFDAYLAKYPDGTFSGLARAKMAGLQRASVARAAIPAPAPSPAPTSAPLPLAAPAPAAAAIPAVVEGPAPVSAPAPVVLAASTPSAAPLAQATEVIPATATVSPAEQSSPLTKLLAQLRGTSEQAPAQIAAQTPAAIPSSSTAAPPIQTTPVASYASARPVMLPVPEVTIPSQFCSPDARNAFHTATYRPAVEAATRNNEAAVTYLRQLQQTYDRGQLGRDTAVLNAIAAEARAYQADAAQAYSAQAALVHQFDALMAVPVHTCVASAR